jgi:hypothetical protein
MSLKYLVFSILFFFIVIFLGMKNYDTWTHPLEISLEKRGEKKRETRAEVSPVVTGAKDLPSIASYILVAEKNIFSPERKDFPFPMAVAKKPSARPQVILYGVSILEERQYASIANPGRALKKGEREIMTLKQGEQIGEYKLVEILPDRIRLEASGDSFEVLLYDPAMPKRRSDTKAAAKKPAAITTTGPVSAPASADGPKPAPFPSQVPAEKPKVPPQEAVSAPPVPPPAAQTSPPSPPSNTPTDYPGRSRRLPYPPPRAPLQQGGS